VRQGAEPVRRCGKPPGTDSRRVLDTGTETEPGYEVTALKFLLKGDEPFLRLIAV
jgi:hypothetical protein